MDGITIDNPARWFFAFEEEAEWWRNGGDTREACITKATADWSGERGEAIWIIEAKRMLPDFNVFSLFDGDDIVERIQDSEVWGEDGWEGAGDTEDLEKRLNAALTQWFNETCTLDGAGLDFVHGPERIDPALSS